MSVHTPTRGHGYLAARIVTEALAPTILIAVLTVAIGWHAGTQAGVSRWWGLPAAVFAAAIPFGYIVRGVRRGRFTNHHIPERHLRRTPLLVGIVSVAVGLVLLAAVGAPRDLVALLVAGVVGLAVFATITYWWQISIHAGVAAGTVAVLTTVYGPAALAAVPLVVAIGWARIRLAAHTPAQVLVGTATGALIAAVVFSLLR